MRRWVSLLLALVLLVGSAAPALAAQGGWRSWFLDVPEDNWALPYVMEMHAKGLMKGVGNGFFQPAGPLTRAQAVTVAVRLMGLEDEIYDLDDREIRNLLPFTDRDDIPEWAKPYVAVAVDHDIVPVAEDGLFRANENATRLWVSVLLVRALGYEAEAQAKMKANLPFDDADLIPASLVGYVVAAVDHQLVQGFPDGTFRPNDALTRAQAAALLSRTDRQLGELGRFRPGFLVGDLVRVSERNLTLTLSVQGRDQTFDVDADAPVFLNEKSANLGDLPVGARVSVVLGDDNVVLMVIAYTPVTTPGASGVSGEISAIFLPSEMAGGLGLVVVKTSNGKEQTYPLAPQATATYNGRKLDLDELRVGDQVKVQVIAGVAISIEVTKRGSGSSTQSQIKGTITEIRPYSTSFLGSIDVKVGNTTRTIAVAPEAVITREGNRVYLTDLEVGDEVTVRLAGGVAIRITVDKPAKQEETVRGEIQVIYPATKNSQARIRLKTESGSTRTATLAENVKIRQGSTSLKVEDLQVGDKVQVHLTNGVADEIRILTKVEEVKGTIQQITPATRTTGPKLTVKTASGNRTVTLATDVVIKYGSRKLTVDDLRIGDEVTVKVVDGTGTEVTVTKRGPAVEEVKGTLEQIEPATKSAKARLTVKTAQGTRRINLADDVTIKYGSRTLKLSDLRVGDEVTVTVTDGVGTAIQVHERGPVSEVVTGTIEEIYPVSITFRASIDLRTANGVKTITLAPEAKIYRGEKEITIAELQKGDRATVTLVAGMATVIEVEEAVTEEITGTIEEIYPVSITFRASIDLRTANGVKTITLAPEAKIYRGEKEITIAELQKGDQATVTLVAGMATAIRVEETAPGEVIGHLLAVYHSSPALHPSLIIKTASGVRQILLGPDTVYRSGNRNLGPEDFQPGDRVRVRAVAGVAATVTLQERPRSSLVNGTVVGILDRDITIRLDSRTERTYTLAEDVVPTIGGRKATLDQVYTGDRVQLEVRGDVILKLEVQRRTNNRVDD
ncbi:MAG: S-layer homology domain-containing protein [Symbiobacterium sp.]|uniref:S-layer homology domain-containing protein n=1 Tax=Symbiobacterium sp. TaxID=1971213 RepID=UPI003463BE71